MLPVKGKWSGIWRVGILLLWLALFAGLLKRDVFIKSIAIEELQAIQQAESNEYQSILFKDAKIGYLVSRFSKLDDTSWELDQQATMQLNVAGKTQQITMALAAILSAEHRLKSFSFSFASPFYTMEASGRVEDERVFYELDTGASVIASSSQLPAPPLLATARRSYLLREELKIGEKITVPWFDPFTLTGKSSVIEYHGLDSILIRGRVQRLHHFTEFYSGIYVSFWLDDTGTVIKEESPAGFVFLREPKFKALAGVGEGPEILESVAVKYQGSMAEDIDQLHAMEYVLTFPEEVSLDLVGGRQSFYGKSLRITREDLLAEGGKLDCRADPSSLAATPYIQADAAAIRNLSKEIGAGAQDEMEKIRRLTNWVYDKIEKRPVIGLPDALTTLESLQGDCNEHSALFAALARAADIPTRVVAGVTHHQGAFYYHAWNEACVKGRWISLDTTVGALPAPLDRIRLIIGETEEQVRIGALLGRLEITVLPPPKNP